MEIEIGCVAFQPAVLAAVEQAPTPLAMPVVSARRAAGKEGQAAQIVIPLAQAQAQAVDFFVDDVAVQEIVVEPARFDFEPVLFVLYVEAAEI